MFKDDTFYMLLDFFVRSLWIQSPIIICHHFQKGNILLRKQTFTHDRHRFLLRLSLCKKLHL